MERESDMSEKMIELRGVRYCYPDGTQALRGIDFTALRGERIAVMGANGSGKSTLFLLLNGILKPSSGEIRIDGEPISYSKKGLQKLRGKVGIVFQNPDVQLFSADVFGEISFGALNMGLPEEEARRRVEQVMEELGIAPFRDKPVHLLSGGQKKRVSIADILVMEPEILLLDEPTAALDPQYAKIIDKMIENLSARGITVLLATHDTDRALAWADRILLLDDGMVAADAEPEKIYTDAELLTRTHQEEPAVVEIFRLLTEQGMLPEGLPMPHDRAALAEQIKTCGGK